MTDMDITVATEPVGPADDPAAAEAAPPAGHRSRRRSVLLTLLVLLVPLALVGAIAGGLFAWDSGYEGRVLPGVHVGVADLSGLDWDEAGTAIGATYPYQDGRLVLRTPDGDIAIPYADFGRRPDVDALVSEAMASGRAGGLLDRTVAQIRQAMDGAVIAPRAILDAPALAAAVTAALRPLERDPVDATIAMGATGPVTTSARAGRSVDPDPVTAAAAAAVTGADAPPAPLDTRNEACRSCRMPVSDARLAAELAAPAEEPKFFDDIGCLREFLKQGDPRRSGTVAYVADHWTGAWVRAASAAYSRCPSLETPMGSHLVAHADTASHDRDPALGACVPVAAAEIFGPEGPPDGKQRS